MSGDQLTDFIFGITLFGVVKWFFVLGLVMYLAFAAIIVRQVGVMSESLDDPNNGLITLFAWSHLVMTILLLIISLVIL